VSWLPNADAERAIGPGTLELDHPERKAMANVSPLPDGTIVLSVSIVVAGPMLVAQRVAERLLNEFAPMAVRL